MPKRTNVRSKKEEDRTVRIYIERDEEGFYVECVAPDNLQATIETDPKEVLRTVDRFIASNLK